MAASKLCTTYPEPGAPLRLLVLTDQSIWEEVQHATEMDLELFAARG
jgi:hypothetical protein